MSDKLSLNNELAQLDLKSREFYDELTEDERKKFSPYLMMKYSANVDGNHDLQSWYLLAANERVNRNFFDMSKHPKLQWLLCTSVSPGMGKFRHFWLSAKKKDGSDTKAIKFLTKLYPYMKQDEIELLASINTDADLKKLAKDMGMADSDIKKEFG
jgi:hypothetical protein